MDGMDVNLAILNYRNFPRDEHLGSPAQRLMNRRLRSSFPVHDSRLEPQVVKHVEKSLQDARECQQNYATGTNNECLGQCSTADRS